MFYALWLLYLRCLIWLSRHSNKDKWILLAYIQHSQPHITLYWAVIILSCGGNMLRKVESLITIIYSTSLAYLSPHSSGVLTIILCISLTNTCNKNFGTKCGYAGPSIDNLRHSLAIGDCTIRRCCIIQLWKALLTHSMNFFMSASLWYTGSQHTECSNWLALWFINV